MRIHVTGNAGSGKSTLAHQIGTALKLPVFGLDQVVWQPGWQKTPPAERDRLESELISKPAWIIEGVSHSIRRAADVTIFLDVPRRRCIARCWRRNLPYLFRSRPGLPENCPEYKIVLTLLQMIWAFPDRVRPIVLSEVSPGRSFIHLTDPNEFCLEQLKRTLFEE